MACGRCQPHDDLDGPTGPDESAARGAGIRQRFDPREKAVLTLPCEDEPEKVRASEHRVEPVAIQLLLIQERVGDILHRRPGRAQRRAGHFVKALYLGADLLIDFANACPKRLVHSPVAIGCVHAVDRVHEGSIEVSENAESDLEVL